MKSAASLDLEQHREPPSRLGEALGIAVLALCLVAVAVPIFGAHYLARFSHGASLGAAAAQAPSLVAPPAAALPPAVAPLPPAAATAPHAANQTAPGEAMRPLAALPAALAVPAALEVASVAPSAASPVSYGGIAPTPAAADPAHGRRGAASDPVIDIAFPQGSAKLLSDRRGELTEIAANYRKLGGIIRIVGYGEPSGGRDATEQTSFGLAIDRAKAVAVALSQLGVSPGDLRVEAAPLHSVAASGSVDAGAEIFVIRS